MQINGNSVEFSYGGLDEAFPPCDAGVRPFGSRVLCQIRTPKTMTKGGIILTGDVRETEHYNTQVAKVIDIGTSASSSEIAKVAVETNANVVAVSTYNGMALSLGRQLQDELKIRGVSPRIFLGGRLNEDLEDEPAAEVSTRLEALGIAACGTLTEMVERLRQDNVNLQRGSSS